MRRSSRQGIMALENENLDTPNEELGAAPESLETDLLEVNDEAEEAAVDQEQTDEAVETAEALESAVLALESAVQNGGLNADGAHILDLHVKSLYGRIGMQRQSVPALESFGGTSSRQKSTQIALEDIKESIKKIWEKIVAAIKSAIQWVKDRFNKVFGAAEKLQKRAKALAEKAGATSGTPKEKQLESERLVKSLHIGGQVPASLGTQAQELNKLANGIFGGVTTWNGKTGDEIVDLLDDPAKLDSFVLPSFPTGELQTTKAGPDFGDAGNGMQFVVSHEMPGGMAIIGRIPAEGAYKGAQAVELLGRAGYNIGAHNPKAKAPSKTQVTTLQPSEAEKIATAVESLAEELQSYRRNLDKLTATKEKILKAAEKASKASDNSSDEGESKERTNNKLLAKLGMAVPKLIDQPAVGFSAYALNTGKAMLDYVELSLKQYGAK